MFNDFIQSLPEKSTFFGFSARNFFRMTFGNIFRMTFPVAELMRKFSPS